MGLILNSYGRKLPFKELMSLTIENLKKEAPVCLTMKTGSSVTLRNQIFFRQNLTQALHFFDPNEEDPEVAAFRHGLIVYDNTNSIDQRPDRSSTSTPQFHTDPLSSIHQFNTRTTPFQNQNPSVPHTRQFHTKNPSVQHTPHFHTENPLVPHTTKFIKSLYGAIFVNFFVLN